MNDTSRHAQHLQENANNVMAMYDCHMLKHQPNHMLSRGKQNSLELCVFDFYVLRREK